MTGDRGPAVVFDQVFKAFGANQVLRNVSFSVPAGNVLCVLGRSGTGKSVTLKLLMALIKPDQGSIWVDGEDITRLEPAGVSKVRRKMSFLFQDAALFDSLTLYDNLALPLRRLTQKTAAEIDFAVDDVLGHVGLAGDKNKFPSSLSGGMRKRAGLARALVLEPKVPISQSSSIVQPITYSSAGLYNCRLLRFRCGLICEVLACLAEIVERTERPAHRLLFRAGQDYKRYSSIF
jgi:phospholipid/cholesterol/gamma-HCH transport system ATP-binding protein